MAPTAAYLEAEKQRKAAKARLVKEFKKAGYEGAQGGWIYKVKVQADGTRSYRAICQGWDSLFPRLYLSIDKLAEACGTPLGTVRCKCEAQGLVGVAHSIFCPAYRNEFTVILEQRKAADALAVGFVQGVK
jgi:hypothetical protein